MFSPNMNQLQSMDEKTRNALSLQIYAFETKIYNIEQHTEQYIRLIDKLPRNHKNTYILKQTPKSSILYAIHYKKTTLWPKWYQK